MKNRDKDVGLNPEIKTFCQLFFAADVLKMKKLCLLNTTFCQIYPFGAGILRLDLNYFFRYITSFTSVTVRGTSGKAAATKFGA